MEWNGMECYFKWNGILIPERSNSTFFLFFYNCSKYTGIFVKVNIDLNSVNRLILIIIIYT